MNISDPFGEKAEPWWDPLAQQGWPCPLCRILCTITPCAQLPPCNLSWATASFSLYLRAPAPSCSGPPHRSFYSLTSCCHSLDLSDSNHPSGQMSLPWEKCPHPVDYFVCPPPHSLFLWNTDDWRKHLWLLWLFQLFSFPDDGLSAELYCDPRNSSACFLTMSLGPQRSVNKYGLNELLRSGY